VPNQTLQQTAGHVGFSCRVAHSAPAAAELCRWIATQPYLQRVEPSWGTKTFESVATTGRSVQRSEKPWFVGTLRGICKYDLTFRLGVSKLMSIFKVPTTHLQGSFLVQPMKLSGNI
jgi:hypothetical protein